MAKGDFISTLMSLGRHGDNTIGHLTEGEIVIPKQIVDEDPSVLTPFIRAMTKRGRDWRPYVVGQGSVNPNTGMQEFPYGWGGSDRSPSSGGRESFGGSRGGTSYGSRDNASARQAERNIFTGRSVPETTYRPRAEAAGLTPVEGTNRERTFQEGGPMGSAGSRPGGPADVADDEPGLFGSMLGDAVGPPSGKSLGLLGTLIGLTPGVGTLMGVTALAQALGLEGEVDWEPGRPNPGAREDSGQLDYRSPRAQAIKRIATAAAAAGLIDPPGWLTRSIEGLSPLQTRAHIATQGTAGSDSGYRSRDVFDYYRGLLTNTPYENVLPVEHQFLKDIWGANYGANTSSLMQALAAI